MDPGLSRAVREAFVRLARGRPHLPRQVHRQLVSALPDRDLRPRGHPAGDARPSWTIRYPLADGGGWIEVATTRPETMLGDTGIAVHPDDERYRSLIGRNAVLPLVGRPLPIVADRSSRRSSARAAVKITPAHDPNDFEAAGAPASRPSW